MISPVNQDSKAQQLLPKIHRLAAIDLGSNAVRLAINECYAKEFMVPLKRSRKPLRLGECVFDNKIISKKHIEKGIRYFSKFRDDLEKFRVDHYHAVATSALRNAENRDEFIAAILKKTGIKIDLISGEQEASFISTAISEQIGLQNKNVLCLDIGGGSSEVTILKEGIQVFSKSLPFGTVRSLQILEELGVAAHNPTPIENKFLEAILPIREKFHDLKFDIMIGTGGNCERFGKIQGYLKQSPETDELDQEYLEKIRPLLQSMTRSERMETFLLKPDRADVIIPAGAIIETAMRVFEIESMVIPGVGLKDGVLSELARRVYPSYAQ